MSSKDAKGERERAWALFLGCDDKIDFREFEISRVGFDPSSEFVSEGEEAVSD